MDFDKTKMLYTSNKELDKLLEELKNEIDVERVCEIDDKINYQLNYCIKIINKLNKYRLLLEDKI